MLVREAGEQGAGLLGSWRHPPVLKQLQRPAQAGFGFAGLSGQTQHLRLRGKRLAQDRVEGHYGDLRQRFVRQPDGGAELAAPGEHFARVARHWAWEKTSPAPASASASSVSRWASSKRPCA